jgi:hypothetical protein
MNKKVAKAKTNAVTLLIATAIIAVGFLGMKAAHAEESQKCKVYRLDIQAELFGRGYSFPMSYACYQEPNSAGKWKFTVVIDGNKEIIRCSSEECN